jgi:hypoxanthine phosphoribosyltransferase
MTQKKRLPHVKTLHSNEDLRNKICELGDTIAAEYDGKEVIVISVLTGAIRFTGSLIARMNFNLVQVEPVTIRSYRGTKSGVPKPDLLGLTRHQIEGKHILLADDILDTGQTLSLLHEQIRKWKPASLKSAVMLHKSGCQLPQFNFRPDYWGFQIENHFVVGFGLDYRGLFRNLNYIGILEKDQQQEIDELLGPIES